MSISAVSLVKAIKCLPCFTSVQNMEPVEIQRIEQGQSSYCFKVLFRQQYFFVKYLKQNVGVNSEVLASQRASNHHIAPNIVFANQNWLVSVFVEGVSLNLVAESINKKIDTAILLMIECHALPCELPNFNVNQTIRDLIASPAFSRVQSRMLLNVLDNIQTFSQEKQVTCHGDLNFSNIIIGEKPWLLDFECACLAEPEFDLAMFIAINELTTLHSDYAISTYCKRNNSSINKLKVHSYTMYSYLLNALWYLDKVRNTENELIEHHQKALFESLGLKQLLLFDQLSEVNFNLSQLMR
jgi:thiamine kinase-like enzyme